MADGRRAWGPGVAGRGRTRQHRAIASLLADITPLRRSPDYRRLFGGQAVAFLGRQVTIVAAPLQVYNLTNSSAMVGLLGLAQLPFLIAGSMLGGTLADAHERRRLLLIANVFPLLFAAGLAWNASRPGQGAVWPIFVLTALQAGISGIDSPTRSAVTPELVGEDLITAASALNQILFHVGGVSGPALAGIVIARWGVGPAYWMEVAAFGLALLMLLRMHRLPPPGGGTRAGVASILEGLRFLRGRRALQGTFLIDINAMVFGMPRALFPELAATVFGGGAATVGLLHSSVAVGGLLGAVTSGWTGRVRHAGRAVLWAVAGWGVATAAFAATSFLPLALACLAVAGASDVVSAVFRNTILQLTVPAGLRGRLNAVHISVVAGGPRLGDLESGLVAAAVGPQVSAVSGGLICVAGVALLARLLPDFAHWTPADAAGPAIAASPSDGPAPAPTEGSAGS
ncbi:MAG: MFS transporter [Acidimicrobiia bacterium]|nr:MFS transporter [Acidimicrobiia bacterium]